MSEHLNKPIEPYKFEYDLGQSIQYVDVEQARVVGIDYYTMRAFSGGTHKWISYTLIPYGAPKEERRFWAVNVPKLGAHFFRVANPEQVKDQMAKALYNPHLSGHVTILSEGRAELSGGRLSSGSLVCFSLEDGTLYVEEVFEGIDTEPLYFVGKKFEPPELG